MDALTRGQVARAAGVNLETVRYYERLRLLPKAPRSRAGWRLFPPESIARVRFVKQAQNLGFSLREIRELMALQADPDADLADIRAKAVAKVAEIDAKIEVLRTMRDTVERLTRRCPPRGKPDDCPIWECFAPEKECCGRP